jgi:hypothetical protein
MRCVLVTCVCLAGCQVSTPPEALPPISQVHSTIADDHASGEVTADDRAIMSAVLDGALRADRDSSIRAGRATPSDPALPTGALFLVFDSTVPACAPGGLSPGNWILGCFDVREDSLQRLLDEFACNRDGRTAGAMLARRNERSLAIRGSLGEDVVVVSSDTINNGSRFSELLRRYPIGSRVVTFSAPIYVKSGAAVVYYRAFNEGLGFMCLAQRDNRWYVQARKNVIE